MIELVHKKNYSKVSIAFTSTMSSTIAMRNLAARITTLLSVCGAMQMKMGFWIKYSTRVGTSLFISTFRLLRVTTVIRTFCNSSGCLRISWAIKCKTDSLAYPKATMNYLITLFFWSTWASKLIPSRPSSMEKCFSLGTTTRWKMSFYRKRRSRKIKSGSSKSKRNSWPRGRSRHRNSIKRKARVTPMQAVSPPWKNKSLRFRRAEHKSRPRGRNSTRKSLTLTTKSMNFAVCLNSLTFGYLGKTDSTISTGYILCNVVYQVARVSYLPLVALNRRVGDAKTRQYRTSA